MKHIHVLYAVLLSACASIPKQLADPSRRDDAAREILASSDIQVDPKDVQYLLSTLDDASSPSEVKLAAIKLLDAWHDESIIVPLVKAHHDWYNYYYLASVVSAALKVLSSFARPVVKKHLKVLVQSNKKKDRLAVVRYFLSTREGELVHIVLPLLKDSEKNVRDASLSSVAVNKKHVQTSKVIASLIKLMTAEKDERGVFHLFSLIRHLDPQWTAHESFKASDRQDLEVMKRVEQILKMVGEPRRIIALVKCIKDETRAAENGVVVMEEARSTYNMASNFIEPLRCIERASRDPLWARLVKEGDQEEQERFQVVAKCFIGSAIDILLTEASEETSKSKYLRIGLARESVECMKKMVDYTGSESPFGQRLNKLRESYLVEIEREKKVLSAKMWMVIVEKIVEKERSQEEAEIDRLLVGSRWWIDRIMRD